MAITTASNVVLPELFDQAVQGALAGGRAFLGDALVSTGVARVSDTFTVDDPTAIGTSVAIPYFGSVGKFVSTNDGTDATPVTLTQTKETASVQHSVLAFELTRWAQFGAIGGDPYESAANGVARSLVSAADDALITAAVAANGTSFDYYSSSVPQALSWDMVVDGRVNGFGDAAQSQIAAMVVHSKVAGDLMKQKAASGAPLLLSPDGRLLSYMGVPLIVSDSLPVAGELGAVTSAGTSPPAIAITTNTPNRRIQLKIKCTLGGARATAKIQYSFDNGLTWSADVLTAASITLTEYRDGYTAGEAVGVVISYANASANVDNTWAAPSVNKYTTLIARENSLAFWYNGAALRLQTQQQVLRDSTQAAMHLYFAAHRYKRCNGSPRPGIVALTHN